MFEMAVSKALGFRSLVLAEANGLASSARAAGALLIVFAMVYARWTAFSGGDLESLYP